MGSLLKTVLAASVLTGFSLTAFADTSPTLLIETGPSDNPNYRRMVSIKYLSGTRVTANYKAYNRREFINTPNTTPSDKISTCVRGQATSLRDIKSFERDENRRSRSDQAPESRTFCIKNIQNWTQKNKDIYLDPIFDSMPYLAK